MQDRETATEKGRNVQKTKEKCGKKKKREAEGCIENKIKKECIRREFNDFGVSAIKTIISILHRQFLRIMIFL